MSIIDNLKFDFLTIMYARRQLKSYDTTIPDFETEYSAPGQNTAVHNGFVNSASNTRGLQANFFSEQNGIIACRWTRSDKSYEGYPGIIHGGISSCLVDELMGNASIYSQNKFGMTLKQRIFYHTPIKTNEVVYGRSTVSKQSGQKVQCTAYLFNDKGRVTVTAIGTFLLPTLRQFKAAAKISEVPKELHAYFGGLD